MNHFHHLVKMVNHIVDANDMAHKLINYEVLMNKLYEEIKAAVKRYDNNRLFWHQKSLILTAWKKPLSMN